MLLVMGGLSLILLVVFVIMTASFWWKIKHGQGALLEQTFYGKFTTSGAKQGLGRIDRQALETADNPFLGKPGSPLTIVEFADFECPNCKLAAPTIYQLVSRHPDKIKIIVRYFPVESLHPGSSFWSQLAFCANKQGRFWSMHDALFETQDELVSSAIVSPAAVSSPVAVSSPTAISPAASAIVARLAERSGTDVRQLSDCVTSPLAEQKVRKDYLTGIDAGVRGTPTFFVNGVRIEGAVPLAKWEELLQQVSSL